MASQIDTILAAYPPAPIDAYDICGPADWHDVPKGFYAVPVWDWHKFMNDCGPDGETPDLDLIGFQLLERRVSRTYKTGKKAGQQFGKDELKVGRWIVAPGATEYVVQAGLPGEKRYSPWDRVRQEIESYRHCVQHELVDELPPGTALCTCCPSCRWSAKEYPGHMAYIRKPNARTAYTEACATAILDSISNHDDAFRRLYGILTGSCGICGALLTDPKSKLIGIGPDCRGYR